MGWLLAQGKSRQATGLHAISCTCLSRKAAMDARDEQIAARESGKEAVKEEARR